MSDETFPLAACGLLYHLLACLFEEKAWGLYTEEQLEQRQKANRYIRPALQYVAQHFERNITVDELADSCSLSKYHFCRQFRKLTGQTPIQYLNEYRIKRAELMLKNGRESVAEIARQVGFADESYFSRCFKAARGVSPAQVRAEQDGAAAQNRTQK